MSLSPELRPALASRVLTADLLRLATPEKALEHFLTALRAHLGADAAWLHAAPTASPRTAVQGRAELYDEALSARFAGQERPEVPRRLLLAPLRVAGRRTGVIGVARAEGEFELGQGRTLNKLVPVLGEDLARREEDQVRRVLERIHEKILARLRPRDLAYQILDGLAQLVHYDHSAAIFLYDPKLDVLRLDAEKVAWTKGKSAFIGHEVPLHAGLAEILRRPEGLYRYTEGAADPATASLFAALDAYHRGASSPTPTSSLYAPLLAGGDLVGVLKLAARRRLPFEDRDVEIVRRFLPAAGAALSNAQANVSLEDRAVSAELRAGLVTLARAVAHDVNGAVATISLLAEQARAEVEAGQVDPELLHDDLDGILEKAALCRRIFSNMLRLGSERMGAGPVDVNLLVQEVQPLLQAQIGGRPIELALALADALPVVRSSRLHLERILWNLVTNAIEALADGGGRIEVSTRAEAGGEVALVVADDGPGIPQERLGKVQEPFFTTKPNGHGLGLSICRSLAWQLGGSLQLASAAGAGTRAEVRLPLAAPLALRAAEVGP
jgi:two-component system, NtrC family, sensor kinase